MKAYTYNDRLVGVGNDQILGTDQGGGSTYTAGNGIDITNDVISVDDTVALVSALPTTELGKFTIQSNVSGGPIEVLIPTDESPLVASYQINTVSGTPWYTGTSTGVLNYYYGETPASFTGLNDYVMLTVSEDISNVASIAFYYASSSTGIGGPNLGVTNIVCNGTLTSGLHYIKAQYNQAGTSSPYGTYLQLMVSFQQYAPDYTTMIQWMEQIASKVTLFAIGSPDASLGCVVNLDRYYLGNTNTTTSNSGTQALIYTDPNTKKQTVFMPSSIPSNWKSDIIQTFQYGNTYVSPSSSYYETKQYRAYKYTSSPRRYQFAYCTDWDSANSVMTFVAYDNSGNAIEKWTVNYATYGSAVWTTETISQDMSDYISYSASGVYLPNSKFEIDTEGQAYKVISEGSESDYGSGVYSWSDGALYFHPQYSQLGTYTATFPSNTDHLTISQGGGIGFTYTFDSTTYTATFNVSALPNGAYAYVWAKDSNDDYVYIGQSNTPVKYIVPAVTEEYLTVGDLELNGDNQVTAIDGHALAGNGGTTYTAGQYISIDSNDVISVTGLQVAGNYATTSDISDMATKTWVGNQGYLTSVPEGYATDIEVSQAIASSIVQSDWAVTAVDSPAYIDNKPETLEMELSPVTGGNCISITEGNAGSIDWITTAGITDIVSVTALPANPVATVIYLIPET